MSESFDLKDREFRFLAKFLNEKTGIVLGDNKRPMMNSRLSRRLRALKLQNYKQYCDFIVTPEGETEMPHMVNAITTNLTKFFREKHHFEYLKNTQIPKILASQRGGSRLRIWSAGCSSGEEPYSIAMTLRETLKNIDGTDTKILATDLDTNMVSHASQGLYKIGRTVEEGLTKRQLKEYTDAKVINGNDHIQMKNNVRKLITFKQLNLLHPFPMKGPFDVVFCRNVVIYFDKDTQRTLFKKMAQLMPLGSILCIGHSENLSGVSDDFKLIGQTIYERV